MCCVEVEFACVTAGVLIVTAGLLLFLWECIIMGVWLCLLHFYVTKWVEVASGGK